MMGWAVRVFGGTLFLVTVSYNLRVCLCLPSNVELLRCTGATAPRLHTYTLCVVCASHFMEEALVVVLLLASRARFDTAVSEPSCV